MSHLVCLCAHVCGVMVVGSAALVGMYVRCALGLRNVKHRGCVIRAMYDARIAGAVSSAVSRVLCRSIAIAALLLLLCDGAALHGIVFFCG